MSEQWAIALITIFGGLALSIGGWGAASLWGIHKDLRNFVTRDECNRDMDDHCDRLDSLTQDLTDLSKKVSGIEAAVNIYHSSTPKKGAKK